VVGQRPWPASPTRSGTYQARVSGSEAASGFMGLCTRSCDSDAVMSAVSSTLTDLAGRAMVYASTPRRIGR
jgi:hypothetical protein